MRHRLVPIDRAMIDADPGKPAVFGRVLAGSPVESCVSGFDDGNGRFASGVWRCTPGVVAMTDWPYDEFCVLLSGRVIISPQGGAGQEFAAGASFVIPRGFTGTWDIRETVTKCYAIQRHPGLRTRLKHALARLWPVARREAPAPARAL